MRVRLLPVVLMLCLALSQSEGDSASTDLTQATTPPSAVADNSVASWFQSYDQIRRDAELSLPEKLQLASINEYSTPGKRTIALVKRMISLYSDAVTALKALPRVPATSDLQDGFILYFSTAVDDLNDFLTKAEAGAAKGLMRSKKQLEELDKSNKKLDAELRRNYGIPRHRHR